MKTLKKRLLPLLLALVLCLSLLPTAALAEEEDQTAPGTEETTPQTPEQPEEKEPETPSEPEPEKPTEPEPEKPTEPEEPKKGNAFDQDLTPPKPAAKVTLALEKSPDSGARLDDMPYPAPFYAIPTLVADGREVPASEYTITYSWNVVGLGARPLNSSTSDKVNYCHIYCPYSTDSDIQINCMATVEYNGKVYHQVVTWDRVHRDRDYDASSSPKPSDTPPTTADAQGDKNYIQSGGYKASVIGDRLDFGTAKTGYSQPAGQRVTIKNEGSSSLLLLVPNPTYFYISDQSYHNRIESGVSFSFTLRPRLELDPGEYEETIPISTQQGIQIPITAKFVVTDENGQVPRKPQAPTLGPEYVLDGTTLKKYTGTASSLTIPDGITAIGDYAFSANKTLTSVTIPGSVKEIGLSAFQDCANLSKLTIENGVKIIGSAAFMKCSGLTSVSVPESVETMKDRAFYFCGLTSLTVNGANTSVDDIVNAKNTGITIYGKPGSPVEKYAKEAGFTFAVIGSQPAAPASSKFTDVAATSPFAAAISWAVEKNITTGKTATTFAPGEKCSNGQILTFLWRANGSPEPTIASPFTDTIPNSFQKAAVWAYEKGLVSGTVFGSGTPCTRAMAVTYLWQLAGKPTAAASSFSDVAADADYAQAIHWAVQSGVTKGTGDGTTFSPDGTCTRGQIVTFLYRALSSAS